MKSEWTRMVRMAAVGWMSLILFASLVFTGCGRDPLLAKAKAEEKAGNINLFGFYTGMPREDADALAARYGLTGVQGLVKTALSFDMGLSFLGLNDTSMFHEHPETHEVYAMLFSLQDVQRMTKTKGTFKELAQAVANQVGELEYDGDTLKRNNISGVSLIVSSEYQFCLLLDNKRSSAAQKAKRQAEQQEEERARLEAQREAQLQAERKAEEAKAKIAAINEKLRTDETRKPGETKTITLPGGATMEMVWCPPGAFLMGSPENEVGRDNDEKQHIVTLSTGFWMGKTEVTQTQWESVMRKNSSSHKRQDQELPVEQVRWNHCLEFCLKAGVRLPTEAEWEYACRAGATGMYGGTGSLEEMGWFNENSDGRTHPVGKKQPNEWGLHDMHGNVEELCADWYGQYEETVTDPTGLLRGNSSWATRGWFIDVSGTISGSGGFVPQINVRGGSWDADAAHCRAAYRGTCGLQQYDDYDSTKAGFRVCISEGLKEAERKAQAEIASINKQLRADETQAPGTETTIILPGGVKMEMVWCPPGAFLMGSPAEEPGREASENQHQVTLSEGFWMGKTEVTQAQWKSVMGENPSNHTGNDALPVEDVSWNECYAFCKKTGLRLPTEAQWEYACRAGSTGAFGGTGNPDEMAIYDATGWYSHYHGNYNSKTEPVGRKKPNAWGLHDMHGNVREWCSGWYAPYPAGAVTDPTGPDDADERVSRGGSCAQCAYHCRSAARYSVEYEEGRGRDGPDTYSYGDQGFRVCCSAAELENIIEKQRAFEAQQPKAGTTKTITLPGGVTMEMVWCPPGTFTMGSLNGDDEEKPPHQVTLAKGFWMGKTEVTQAQWKSVMGNNPSAHKGDSLPVENVEWDDCREFCEKLGLQLPTEAQWEYACRAGSTGPYAGTGNLEEMGWYEDNSGGETHPVGTKQPNAWGLYDMHGNVWECCADRSSEGTDQMARGGGWGDDARSCTSSCRNGYYAPEGADCDGFRLVSPLSE